MMADTKSKSASSSESSKSSKSEPRETMYTVIGALGPKDAKPDGLTYYVLGHVSAISQAAAKGKVLAANPEFPTLGNDSPEDVDVPMDLQALVRKGSLWLDAESNWAPKLVEIDQPPPKFTGL